MFITKKPTILFVEDEPNLVDLYHLVFDDNGYNFLSTKSVEEAMMFCEREEIALVLLDILLPGKSGQIEKIGFDFLKDVKKNPKTKNIPVVVLSNLDSFKDRREGLSFGADDYLFKLDSDPMSTFRRVEEVLEFYKSKGSKKSSLKK